MTYSMKLEYYMKDCPICWRNFVNDVFKDSSANGNGNDKWNPYVINKNLIKFNGYHYNEELIFDSEADAVYFKMVWG